MKNNIFVFLIQIFLVFLCNCSEYKNMDLIKLPYETKMTKESLDILEKEIMKN